LHNTKIAIINDKKMDIHARFSRAFSKIFNWNRLKHHSNQVRYRWHASCFLVCTELPDGISGTPQKRKATIMNHNQNPNQTNADEDQSETENGSSSVPQEVPPTKQVPEQQPATKAGFDSEKSKTNRDPLQAGGRQARDADPGDSSNKDGEE
jgi:hypothetical protein